MNGQRASPTAIAITPCTENPPWSVAVIRQTAEAAAAVALILTASGPAGVRGPFRAAHVACSRLVGSDAACHPPSAAAQASAKPVSSEGSTTAASSRHTSGSANRTKTACPLAADLGAEENGAQRSESTPLAASPTANSAGTRRLPVRHTKRITGLTVLTPCSASFLASSLSARRQGSEPW